MKRYEFTIIMGACRYNKVVWADSYGMASNVVTGHYPRSAIISLSN